MLIGYLTGALWAFKAVQWLWLVVVVLDFVVGPDTCNPPGQQAEDFGQSLTWRLAVWLGVPVQVTLIGCGLCIMTWPSLTIKELVVVTVSVGIASGMVCMPVAHELMHGKRRCERILAEVLMTLVSYPHFCIEHVHGHHHHVGTDADPATARLGESFYDFYPRTVIGSVVSAWSLEAARLQRFGVGIWSVRNRMVRYMTLLVIVYAAIGCRFGWLGVAFFAVQSVISFSLLEVINYIEHYGLVRREIAPGRYERVMPWHAWNSSHRVSNWMLFNLGRHSDHHYQAVRSYQCLRHFDATPQLPTGYFGMFLLPLFPPLWRRMMDPRVQAWRRQYGMPSAAVSMQ
jgi:alkane 1-monooxygenase